MTIKEIIDAERWSVEDEHGHYGCQVYKHNACLDRIEAAVIRHLIELRNDDYQIVVEREKVISNLRAELHSVLVVNEVANKRITELEADKRWLYNFLQHR